MSFLKKIMDRLNDWMNDGENIYKFEMAENEIYIDNFETNEHIATVEKNLSYKIINKIEVINNENDLNKWIFLQLTNCKLIRILSTV